MTTTKTGPARSAEIHGRRAVTALDALIERAALIRTRLEIGEPADPEMAYDLADHATRVAVHLGALEALRDEAAKHG